MFACGERGGKHKLFSSLRSRDMLGFAERDIFALQMRYYLAMRDSDIFAVGECGGKHATYKSSRRAVRGISRFCISLAIRQISQIREDLYRFSLSASRDKLNFPRGLKLPFYALKQDLSHVKQHRVALIFLATLQYQGWKNYQSLPLPFLQLLLLPHSKGLRASRPTAFH